jgi:hypothetical protein
MLVGLVSKCSGLPTQRLVGIEFFIAGSSRDNAVVFESGKEAREVSFGRVFDPAVI